MDQDFHPILVGKKEIFGKEIHATRKINTHWHIHWLPVCHKNWNKTFSYIFLEHFGQVSENSEEEKEEKKLVKIQIF